MQADHVGQARRRGLRTPAVRRNAAYFHRLGKSGDGGIGALLGLVPQDFQQNRRGLGAHGGGQDRFDGNIESGQVRVVGPGQIHGRLDTAGIGLVIVDVDEKVLVSHRASPDGAASPVGSAMSFVAGKKSTSAAPGH
jgi:hypothetical protein